jgi:hypothetical protein
LTNDELEQQYENIDDEIINLPQQFKKLRLGLLPRICQLFITALKQNSNKIVKFYQFESDKEDAVTDLLESPHCLTALIMSDEVYEKDMVLDGNKVALELKSKINIDIQKRLNESIYRKGQRVQLFAVDHSVKKYAFPSCFYSPEGTNSLKKSNYYTNLLKRIIELSPTESTVSEEQIRDLGQVIYELIENTEQHGKLEFDTGKVNKSVRGLVIDYKLIVKGQSTESIGGVDTAISCYLDATRIDNDTVHLLEISMFDSGEGIFKSLSSNNATADSIQDEVEVVESSFAKGMTSKYDSHGVGRGLYNVRSVLDKRKGFISVRTGKVGVYRDFNLQPSTENEAAPLSLYDEMSKSNDKYNELASVEGLALSILVPLR